MAIFLKDKGNFVFNTFLKIAIICNIFLIIFLCIVCGYINNYKNNYFKNQTFYFVSLYNSFSYIEAEKYDKAVYNAGGAGLIIKEGREFRVVGFAYASKEEALNKIGELNENSKLVYLEAREVLPKNKKLIKGNGRLFKLFKDIYKFIFSYFDYDIKKSSLLSSVQRDCEWCLSKIDEYKNFDSSGEMQVFLPLYNFLLEAKKTLEECKKYLEIGKREDSLYNYLLASISIKFVQMREKLC